MPSHWSSCQYVNQSSSYIISQVEIPSSIKIWTHSHIHVQCTDAIASKKRQTDKDYRVLRLNEDFILTWLWGLCLHEVVSWSFLSRKLLKVSPQALLRHAYWSLLWSSLVFLVGVSLLESLGEPAGGVSREGLKLWTLGVLALGVLGEDLDCLLLWGDLERDEDGEGEVVALNIDTVEAEEQLVEDWTVENAPWVFRPTFQLNSLFFVSIHFTGRPVLDVLF